jgi:hypothetical protein
VKQSLSPASERTLLGLCVVLGVVLRWQRHLVLEPTLREPLLLHRPFVRPPLLDLLSAPWPDRQWLVLVLSAGTILVTAALGRRALGSVGGVAAGALAAICPALLQAGSLWLPMSLAVLTVPALALALIGSLEGKTGAVAVAGLGILALLSDWAVWAPVLAWLGWLTVFRPEWMNKDQARPALLGLGVAALVSAPVYVWIAMAHDDLPGALGVARLPLGQEALEGLLGAAAAPWFGAARTHPLAWQAAAAAGVVAALWLGPKKAETTGQHAWAGVLFAGSAGAFVPALAAHPWLAIGADKNIWYMSPLVLPLALSAAWPVRRASALAMLLLFCGCTGEDGDGDGWAAVDDCDDEDHRIHPDAYEVFDGVDNDCDGSIDVSADYLFVEDAEPNDTSLAGCFAPDGQDLGTLPRPGLLTRITGRIDDVVAESYTEGDFDCFAFRAGPDSKASRVQVTLSWSDPTTDLDLALQGLFDGVQAGFIQATEPGPGPEVHISSGAFEEGEPLWLWIAGYDGPPTDYTVEILLR